MINSLLLGFRIVHQAVCALQQRVQRGQGFLVVFAARDDIVCQIEGCFQQVLIGQLLQAVHGIGELIVCILDVLVGRVGISFHLLGFEQRLLQKGQRTRFVIVAQRLHRTDECREVIAVRAVNHRRDGCHHIGIHRIDLLLGGGIIFQELVRRLNHRLQSFDRRSGQFGAKFVDRLLRQVHSELQKALVHSKGQPVACLHQREICLVDLLLSRRFAVHYRLRSIQCVNQRIVTFFSKAILLIFAVDRCNQGLEEALVHIRDIGISRNQAGCRFFQVGFRLFQFRSGVAQFVQRILGGL